MATRISQTAHAMRKAPSQARSRATIDAILDATAHILCEKGWKRTTTNLIADRAGVSVGSIYQYFPNKHALAEALRKRHFQDMIEIFRSVSQLDTAPSCRIERLVDEIIAAHHRHPAVHKIFWKEYLLILPQKPILSVMLKQDMNV